MPMFQRRHYEVIASAIRNNFDPKLPEIASKMAMTMVVVFQRDNPRFSEDRFLEAAIPDYTGPEVTFSLAEIEQAQSTVKGLRRKRA